MAPKTTDQAPVAAKQWNGSDGNGRIKSFPTPKQLATPTDLSPEAIRSIAHISQLQTIEDDNGEFVLPEQMVQRLIDDNRHVAQMQRTAVELCDKQRDVATGNILEEILDATEKRIWFLYEISQGGHNIE